MVLALPPKLTAETGVAGVSAPMRSATSPALPEAKTLPLAVVAAAPSATLLVSALAVGVSSTMATVSVPLAVPAPSSTMVSAMLSLVSLSPGGSGST